MPIEQSTAVETRPQTAEQPLNDRPEIPVFLAPTELPSFVEAWRVGGIVLRPVSPAEKQADPLMRHADAAFTLTSADEDKHTKPDGPECAGCFCSKRLTPRQARNGGRYCSRKCSFKQLYFSRHNDLWHAVNEGRGGRYSSARYSKRDE